MQHHDLHALLVRTGLVTVDQVRHAVAAAHDAGLSSIEHLVLTGVLDDELLARWIAHEAVVPACSLTRLSRVRPEVIALVPGDLAVEHRVVPVALDPDGDLCLAMLDPTDRRAVEEVEFFAGRPLLREVAPATALAWALHFYYGVESALQVARARPLAAAAHAAG